MPLDSQLLAKTRFVLVSDLDWTMVDHKDESHKKLLAFNRLWTSHFAKDSLLVFSTGRSPELFQQLAAEVPLLTPDILVCSVGTEILLHGEADSEWEAHLDEGWDRDTAAAVAGRFPELILQQQSEQRPHKVSYKLFAADAAQATGLVQNLRSQLAAAGLDTNVVFSGGEDLDILPARASKGKALSFLLSQIGEAIGGPPSAGVLACGDSGNDVELFEVPGVYGCMVANAHPELREWVEANGTDKIFAASQDGPGGIVQALHNFKLIPEDDPESTGRRKAVVDLHQWFESYFAYDPSAEPEEDSIESGTAADILGEAGLAMLEASLAENFELIGPSGTKTSRNELLTWFREQGRGSRVAHIAGKAAASAADPLANTPAPEHHGLLSAAMASAETPNTPTGIEPPSPQEPGRFRIWIDCFSERELAPGLWLVTYKEIQQRFPTTVTGRTTRWSTAILREVQGRYVWESVHETWVPVSHHEVL